MRCVDAGVDPDTWPAFDARVVAKPLRGTFDKRKQAIELYAAGRLKVEGRRVLVVSPL